MWIVVDSNQAQRKKLVAALDRWPEAGVTLPPFTLAETLLRENGAAELQGLHHAARGRRVRVGLQHGEVTELLRERTESGIRSLAPFLNESRSQQMIAEVTDPGANGWARDVKDDHDGQMARTREAAINVRASLEKLAIKLGSFADAEAEFASRRRSLLRHLVARSVGNGGIHTPRVSRPWRLYGAVMDNPFLRRLWRHELAYLLAASGLFHQNAFRGRSVDFLPGDKRSVDWADISLFLYAADDDVVLTADRRLRDLAAIVDPNLRVGTLEDLG